MGRVYSKECMGLSSLNLLLGKIFVGVGFGLFDDAGDFALVERFA